MVTRSASRHRAMLPFGAAFVILALAACSGSATGAPAFGAPDARAAASSAPVVPGAGGLSDKSGSGTAESSPGGPLPQDQLAATDTFIVRTGSINIEVPKIEDALLQVRTAITGLGGYVSDSDQSNQGDQVSAAITYRVPVARWQDALDAIQKIATKVDSAKSNAVEVTGQVLDLGARIDNLRTTEAALQAIMARATKIADVLDVESKLSDVQGQIEQLTTEQAHLKDQASLATLTVLFGLPPTQAVVSTSRGWDPGAQLDQASAALLGIGQALASAGIWLLIVGVPLGIVLLVVLGLAVFVSRRLRRSRPSAALVVPPTGG
jgi:Domain of unknown function (DUF4349)